MTVVAADTGPINYLLLINEIALLERFFDRVLIPREVHTELLSARAPTKVRAWAAHLPQWCEVRQTAALYRIDLEDLDLGERAAIELALQTGKVGLLMDDAKGRDAARKLGLEVAGTLGLLKRAGQRKLLNFEAALDALLKTNFRVSRDKLKQIRESDGSENFYRSDPQAPPRHLPRLLNL